jgi:hypothetical protein
MFRTSPDLSTGTPGSAKRVLPGWKVDGKKFSAAGDQRSWLLAVIEANPFDPLWIMNQAQQAPAI